MDRGPGFAGMTAHTNNRELRSIEDRLKLALMPYYPATCPLRLQRFRKGTLSYLDEDGGGEGKVKVCR
jgi:hypothetical protein